MAFRGESVEESMHALITAIHYPNKHKTQPFAGYKFRGIQCLQETKACDPALVNLQIRSKYVSPFLVETPLGIP